jgi:hypothetical protein
MHARTEALVGSESLQTWQLAVNIGQQKNLQERAQITEQGGYADYDEMLDKLAERADFIDHGDAIISVVPRALHGIRDLARYGQLFTNDDVWLQLRPLLYTYWS